MKSKNLIPHEDYLLLNPGESRHLITFGSTVLSDLETHVLYSRNKNTSMVRSC